MPEGAWVLSVLSNACVPLLPQEFYELTLMDECKTSQLKTSEALEMASRWEMSQRPFAKSGGGGPSGNAGNSTSAAEQVRKKSKDILLRDLRNFSESHSRNLGSSLGVQLCVRACVPVN